MAGEPDDVDTMVEPVVPSRHRWLAGLLGARPGDRVADLGCGTGGTLATRPPARPRPPPATTAWAPPPTGSGGVLSGRAALFRCRYLAPGGAGPCELTVTPLADGDGTVATHRPGGAVR